MDCFASLAMTMKRLFENLNRKAPTNSRVMRGLDPRIHQEKAFLSKVMDCRVKPGNDDPADKWRARRKRA
jgi:hypothetical protein